MPHIRFAHTDSRIGNLEADPGDTVFLRNLIAAQIDVSVRFIVFHGIARYVDQNLLDMKRAAYEIFMTQQFRFLKFRRQLHPARCCLPADDYRTVAQQFPQAENLTGKLYISAFHLINVQYIINQG